MYAIKRLPRKDRNCCHSLTLYTLSSLGGGVQQRFPFGLAVFNKHLILGVGSPFKTPPSRATIHVPGSL
jgi:hypothetical protein